MDEEPGDDEDDQRADTVDRADPPLGVREQDLAGSDQDQKHAPADIDPRQPGDERGDEDGDLEVVDDPAGVPVVLQRAGAEQLSGGQVDLQEDACDDEARSDEMEPVEDTPKGSHG